MSLISCLTPQNLFGVYELDASGAVLYYKGTNDRQADDSATANLTGCDFFDEIGCFQNVKEFQRRFKNFAADSHPADTFDFNFYLNEQALPVKVKMVRVRERHDSENTNLIIVDIRKCEAGTTV
ncbi:MAG: hypothetical protein ACR2GD_01815 [Pyrinomonadaceae bacterium]